MQLYDTLENKRLAEFITETMEDRTLLKVNAIGCDYERLTLITSIVKDSGADLFFIDMPEGLDELVREKHITVLQFELNGRDRLPHRFESLIEQYSSKTMSLRFPYKIQRFQSRSDFRVQAPQGSVANVILDNTPIAMTIDNISLGGTFCHCLNRHKAMVRQHEQMEEVQLVFSLIDHCIEIPIKKARVCRTEPTQHPKHFGVAFSFIEIGNEAQKRLTQLIYDLQREFLQKRIRS